MRWLRREPRMSVDEVASLEPYLVIGTAESDRALERRIGALPRRDRDLVRRIRRSKADGRSYRIELRGGAAGARRIEWYELPETLELADPAEVTLPDASGDDSPAEPTAAPGAERPLARFRRTGSMLDDGTHVYVCDRPR